MHLPHLDPNFVLWCDVVADVVTTAAASTAAVTALMLWRQKLKEIAQAVEKKL
jgi:hypothetical protein